MQKKIWLYGMHSCIAALCNPVRKCHRLLVTAQAISALDRLQNLPVRLEKVVVASILDKVGTGVVHQGIALQVDCRRGLSMKDLLHNQSVKGVLVLDGITDPRNIGAILRSAVAFGVEYVVMGKDRTVHETPLLCKAASGAFDQIECVSVVNLNSALQQLKDAGYWIYGLDGSGSQSLKNLTFAHKSALVLGSEGKGIRPLVRKNCDVLVAIDIQKIESLNVATAGSIALYAWQIQRGR